jgi:hypothetical protein
MAIRVLRVCSPRMGTGESEPCPNFPPDRRSTPATRPAWQATVYFGRRLRYLGPYGSPESRTRYQEAIAEWASSQGADVAAPAATDPVPDDAPTVAALILRYWEHAPTHYCRHGKPTGTAAVMRGILREFRGMFGQTLLSEFRPSYLVAYRQRLVHRG